MSDLVFGRDREPGLHVQPEVFRGIRMWCPWDKARDLRLMDQWGGSHCPFPMEPCRFYDGERECGQPCEDSWAVDGLPGYCAFHGQIELVRAVREMAREEATYAGR